MDKINRKRRKRKICNGCGAENALKASICGGCGKRKFAPGWVLAKRPVNRQTSVEITAPNPKFDDTEPRLTLSKWWPGGSTKFHILNTAHWEKIQKIVNEDLAPILGWKSKQDIVSDIKTNRSVTKTVGGKTDVVNYEELVKEHPDFLKKLVAAVNPEKLSQQDFKNVLEILGEISDALTNANAGFRESFLGIVKKLPRQKQRALEDLELLLGNWSLQVVTNVAQQVRSRIETINLFEQQVENPKTFEILGDNSIHRILERAMWIVDERYWLLQSNKTLRKFIGEEMSKRDKRRYSKKRPDFVCGTIGQKLIILELKRPDHALSVDDLNQLETYIVLAEDYKNFSSCEGYLVGAKEDKELRRYLRRRSGFKVLHYADIVGYTRERYREFLVSIEES